MRMVVLIIAVMLNVAGIGATIEREWQVGTWGKTGSTATVATADRTYRIETDQFELEVQETVGGGRPLLTVKPAGALEFAIDNDTVYVRQGTQERALRLVKRIAKLKHYAAAGAGHYIKQVGAGGSAIVLEDGSVWDLDPSGQDRTNHWQPLEGIIVTSEDDQAEDGFNYFLNNTDNDEGVLARLR